MQAGPSSAIELTSRRQFGMFALALLGAGCALRVDAAALPAPASLAAELAHALREGRPLLVMASLHGCPFCNVVRDGYLAPLRQETGQPVVQLDMRSTQSVLDFRSKPTTHDALLRAWEVKVAPTLLFFGKGGREVAPRLAGASIPDFYGAYLEDRLRTARRATAA
jgi:thioredoxin-related protein